MNEKALKTLEYNKIIQKLTNKAASHMGKEMASCLVPTSDYEIIKQRQGETSQASSLIFKKGSLVFGGLKDISSSIKRVEIGGALSIEEIICIRHFLYVSKKAFDYFNKEDSLLYPYLEPLFSNIVTIASLEKEIDRCILNQTDIADDASSGLHSVRRNIKISNEKIKDQLNNIIHSQTYKNMLQDFVITMRNGRYCVPIKQEYRNSFTGMVHDQSSTGATLFIEPMSVVQLNNKIKELATQEQIEIEKVLSHLSSLVEQNAESFLSNQTILTSIDFIFAKGELSIEMKGTEPIFNNKGYVNIKKGRHPLISPIDVVPTDIYLGKDFTTLLITGPNTGGKTVSLKTLGLFTLMGQAGLHIAAFDSSELTVFDNVFADIGDEQSIEQNLSTFSSHMSNIVKILENITDKSLVLLDELGAGTDPTEGAALAIAILQHLHEKKIRTAVTTHYSELKVYALSTNNVENASCEFDVETLKPTYKLLIGIPGKSNAFAISHRLGLPQFIIDSAKESMSHEDVRLEDVITDLEISKKYVTIEQEQAQQYRKEAEKLKTDFELQKEKLNNQRDKILLEAKEQARIIIMQTKEETQALSKEFQKHMKEGSTKEAESTRQKMREKLYNLESSIMSTKQNKKSLISAPKTLKKGDKVFVNSLSRTGIVTAPPEQNGDVTIQAGIMKIKVNIQDLSLDKSEEAIKVNSKGVSHKLKAAKSMNISPEIDLRGYMVEEGLERTDKYLDDAFLSGLNKVTIIHGKGTGALRVAIHSYLKNNKHVKNYRLGVYGEGESGVTIIELNK